MIVLLALALVQSTWQDMPPAEYRGTATATVVYADRRNVEHLCGERAVACLRLYPITPQVVVLPVQCSPTRRPVVRGETVNVREEMRDTGYCASVRAHEFGHVNGWRH